METSGAHRHEGFVPAVGFCLAPTMRPALLAPLLLLLLSPFTHAADLPPASGVDGYWSGEVVMEGQQYQIGFEFRRQPDDTLRGRQWFAVLHLFGSPVGDLVSTAEHLRSRSLGLDLTFSGPELVGTIANAHPLRLARSAPLLTTPPTPAFGEPPAPAWVFHGDAAFWASPVADTELAFIGDEGGRLHAVRLRDGTAVWSFDSGAPIHGAAHLDGDTVCFLNDAGQLFQLDRATGRVRWQRDIGGAAVVRHPPAATEYSYDFVGPQPALADGTLYVPAADGAVLAIAANDGSVRWRAQLAGLLRQSVLVADSHLIVAGWDGRITALARADGSVLWTRETGGPATADPVRCGESVLVSSRNSHLYSLSLADGSIQWTRFHAGSWIESAPRVVAGELFIGSSDLRTVSRLDAATGDQRWTTDVLGWTWGTPAVTADTVFAGAAGARNYPIAQEGGMVALDRHTGAPRWRMTLPATEGRFVAGVAGSPVVAAGLVLFADQAGRLYAFPAGQP